MQARIIQELGVKPTIDPATEIKERVQFLRDYLVASKARGYVLGISGGQDSSLAGRLAQMAVNLLIDHPAYQGPTKDYEAFFVAVRLPHGTQKDEVDAQRALQFIRPDVTVTYNIKDAVDSATLTFQKSMGEDLTDYHKGNIKARMRMVAQYAIGGQKNLLVIGTDHAAESVTGFFTKFGDGGADILPLAGLTKRQGARLLKELGADPAIYLKVPTADLLDGNPAQADETELGISYDEIDNYLEGYPISNGCPGAHVGEEAARIIEARFLATRHKRAAPVTPTDTWWK